MEQDFLIKFIGDGDLTTMLWFGGGVANQEPLEVNILRLKFVVFFYLSFICCKDVNLVNYDLIFGR